MNQRIEENMRAVIQEWRDKRMHSASYKTSFYMDSANRKYDWRESERRRQEIKKMRNMLQ